jgi:hypothetical protein
MPPTRSTKAAKAAVSADALEDTQFSLDGPGQQVDGQTDNEPPKKRRKKAPAKNKKVKKEADDSASAPIDTKATPDENSATQTKIENTSKEEQPLPTKIPKKDSSRGTKRTYTDAESEELKQKKREKTRAKQKSKKEKAKTVQCSKEAEVSF